MGSRRSTQRDQIAARILSIVRREGLAPGARLIEQRLADMLGTSRGPVRAALQALAKSGLVTSERNRGYVLAARPDSEPVETVLAASPQREQAYRNLCEDRITRRLPGTVTEAELVRRYGLTRAQLLRLLDRIASEGWVERLPGYGWRFTESLASPEVYAQAAAFRAVIEPAALAEHDYHLEESVICRLREQQHRLFDSGLAMLTIAEIFQVGCDFHEELVRGAGNPFYVEALKRVNSIRRLFAYRTYADHEGLRRHAREHLQLLNLIAEGRMANAGALLRWHLAHPPEVRAESVIMTPPESGRSGANNT